MFCDWAFLKERGDDISEIWGKIPSNIDILVTHGPPLGKLFIYIENTYMYLYACIVTSHIELLYTNNIL